jgi:hypothetical protein
MPVAKCAPALMACLFVACTADAEERFYQVIDATGRMQVIRAPAAQKPVESISSSAAEVALPAPAGEALSEHQEKTQPSASQAPYAAYDGDEFVDSDALDSAHEQPGKNKFYVVNDPAGTRIQSMSEGEGASAAPVRNALPAREYVALKDGSVVVTEPVLLDEGKACLTDKQIQQSEELLAGRMDDVVFDRKLSGFLPASGLVQLYRVSGEGFGSLRVRSYARKDVDPDFVVPRLGFADARGCVTRVTDLYFQRYYAATKSKHPMLEADIVLHVDEAYLFLLTPSAPVKEAQPRPEYRLGSLGRVSVKWQP